MNSYFYTAAIGILEAINPKSSKGKWFEDNYGKQRLANPAAIAPDEKYSVKDAGQVISYKENDGGKFPSSDYTGPEELSNN